MGFVRRVRSNRAYAVANLVVLFAAGSTLAVALALKPDGQGLTLAGRRLPETCVWQHALGRPCPGCGLTRSVALVMSARWRDSLAAHPAGIWVVAMLAAQVGWRTALLVLPGRRPAGLPWADLAISVGAFLAALVVPTLVGGRV